MKGLSEVGHRASSRQHGPHGPGLGGRTGGLGSHWRTPSEKWPKRPIIIRKLGNVRLCRPGCISHGVCGDGQSALPLTVVWTGGNCFQLAWLSVAPPNLLSNSEIHVYSSSSRAKGRQPRKRLIIRPLWKVWDKLAAWLPGKTQWVFVCNWEH